MKIGVVTDQEYKETGMGTVQSQLVEPLIEELDADRIELFKHRDFPFSRTIQNEIWSLKHRFSREMDEYGRILVTSADRMVFDPSKTDAEVVCYVHDIIPTTTGFRLKQNKYLNILSQMFGERWYQNMLKCDKLVCASTKVEQEIIHRTPYTGETTVAYQGVDHLPEESELDSSDRDIDLLYVGDFIERKDPQMIEDVCIELGEKYNIVLVGDPSFEVPEYVDVYSGVSNYFLAGLYRDADFYFHPSKAEGFGRCPAEAMRYGCIPIARRLRINNEILNSYRNFSTLEDVRFILEEGDTSLSEKCRKDVRHYHWDWFVGNMAEEMRE